MHLNMKHVSMGGSVLRVHQVRGFTKSPKIVDVCMNIDILRALTHTHSSSLDVELSARSVTLKYWTSRSLRAGPSLVLGENGGFQWHGAPKEISESLSESKYMVKYIYPTGVRKLEHLVVS